MILYFFDSIKFEKIYKDIQRHVKNKNKEFNIVYEGHSREADVA